MSDDDLLDEATRLAALLGTADGELVRDLVERVQQAEASLDVQARLYFAAGDRYEAAEAKLDKVRERVAGAERGVARDVLAILDGKA